jgi:hypothetical protein
MHDSEEIEIWVLFAVAVTVLAVVLIAFIFMTRVTVTDRHGI